MAGALIIILVLVIIVAAFMQQAKFGKVPKGKRLELIKQSLYFKNGRKRFQPE